MASNYGELEQQIGEVTKKAMEYSLENILNELLDYVETNIYKNAMRRKGQYYGKGSRFNIYREYQQTRGFYNAFKQKLLYAKSSYAKGRVYFDSNTLKGEILNRGTSKMFNRYRSLDGSRSWNGGSVASWMPTFIDQGTKSKLKGRKLYRMYTVRGIFFEKYIINYIDKSFEDIFKKNFEKAKKEIL